MTAAERIETVASELGLTMTAEFVPWSRSRHKSDKLPSLNWVITLLKDGRPILTTDFMMGSAYCPSYTNSFRMSVDEANAIRSECETGRQASRMVGKPILPELASVLASLVSDGSAIDFPTFEDWANDLGYDTDSRSAEKTYRACVEIGLKLRAALGDEGLSRLREACADY